MLKGSWKYALALACAATLACHSDKGPAEAALKLAEEDVQLARAEAGHVMPAEVQSLAGHLAAAKEILAKEDYLAALVMAHEIQHKANSVLARAAAKTSEFATTWTAVSEGLPQTLDAIKSRVDALSRAKKLPAGIDAAKLGAARDGLAAATTAWGEAKQALKDRRWDDAAGKATEARDKATEVAGMLGMGAGVAAPTI